MKKEDFDKINHSQAKRQFSMNLLITNDSCSSFILQLIY